MTDPSKIVPGLTLIYPTAGSLASPTEVTQIPHQDGGDDGPCPGCIALQRADGQIATFGSYTLAFKPMATPGYGERVYDGGNVYIHPFTDGTPSLSFLKSQPYGTGA